MRGASRRAPDAFCVVLGAAIQLWRGRLVAVNGARMPPELACCIHHVDPDWPPAAHALAWAVQRAHRAPIEKQMIEAAISAQWGELR